MLAAQGGHTEAVKALIEVGGNATLTNVVSASNVHCSYSASGTQYQLIT